MEPQEFLAEVRQRLGVPAGRIVDERELALAERKRLGLPASPPHLLTDYRGYPVKLDFIIRDELHFTVNAPILHRVSVRPWTIFDRFLRLVGLLAWAPFPDPTEQRFFLQGLSPENAARYLTPTHVKAFDELYPFAHWTANERGYQCLKGVDIDGGYTPADAVRDLDLLLDIVAADQAARSTVRP
ncbi:MAG: hypothetical protein OZSIB_1110 [Candidatus Ozemobacter sibiricus]|jgi:hypothetical protein|uniref:Uncharacterized protein n=1 Tax=Candidatus Ozemobacter sibiricus TaxID=2268124 RepID=A0A367ZLN6_9BACT|nr:MAG: hypothetical protein OZSIB_1110 [Candidatus Ozemobacter sibiricus]